MNKDNEIKLELNKLEKDYIKQYNSIDAGYNILDGGEGEYTGNKMTLED